VLVLNRLEERPAAQGWLWKLLVVEQRIAAQRVFQFFAGTEEVALHYRLDSAAESVDNAVSLRMLRRGQAMLDAEASAQQIELMPAGGCALAKAEQAVSELAAKSVRTVLIRIGQALSRSREATGGHWRRSWSCRCG